MYSHIDVLSKCNKMITRHHFFAAILFILVSCESYCEDMYLLLCEGETKNVSCPKSTTINVTSATYGYNGTNEEARQACDDWWNYWREKIFFRDLDDTKCHHPKSTSILADKCNGRSECAIGANNEMFGDPCRGTTKYFELYYMCNQVSTKNGDGDGGESDDESKGAIDGNDDDPHDDDNSDDSEEESDDEDSDEDDESEGGLSPVAVVAIAAGIPVGLGLCSLFVIVAFCVALQMKRRKLLATNNRNMSIKQYDREVLTMTVSNYTEDSGMVYNTTYQSVSQDDQIANKTTGYDKIDNIKTNYENLIVEVANENAETEDEGMIYNDTYQSIDDSNPKR